jgi:hypothetical protein
MLSAGCARPPHNLRTTMEPIFAWYAAAGSGLGVSARIAVGELWGLLFLFAPAVIPAAAIALVVYLVLTSSRRRPTVAEKPATSPDATDHRREGAGASPSPAEHRKASRSALAFGVSGLCVPWVVGLAVKFYLDAQGQPTHPISSFVEPTALVILLAATVIQWCWPFLLLALWVRSRHFTAFAPGRSFGERLALAWITYLAGMGAAVVVFIPVFRVWDVMYLFVPIAFFILGPMLVGYVGGLLALRVRDRTRRTG